MNTTKNIAVITTAKNEEKNLERLIGGVFAQGKIATWIFIDDGSDDNTVSCMEGYSKKIETFVDRFEIIKINQKSKYALGPKYSSNIKLGFDRIYEIEAETKHKHSYFAILDADNFISNGYYEILIKKFIEIPTLGIASGKTIFLIDDKEVNSNESPRWAAGSNRVWRRECLLDTDYLVSYSADAVSAARARKHGWKVASFESAVVHAREVGSRFGQEYYGKSCYVRYVPFSFVLLSALLLFIKGRGHVASGLINGYRSAKNEKVPRITDELAISYFKNYLFHNIKERLFDD